MKVIGVVPARYGSTRFPGKALALLRGRPMILHVLEWSSRAPSLARVVVATDDERIERVVQEAGHQAIMTPAECRTGSDRVAAAVAGQDWDVVINIQGDEAEGDPAALEAMLAALTASPECGVATAMTPLRRREDFESPHVVKAVADTAGRALYFSRAPIPSAARLEPDEAAAAGFVWGWKHLGLYAFRRSVLEAFAEWPQTPLERRERLEQLRLMEHGVAIRIIEVTHDAIGVDTPEELGELESALRRKA